MDFRVLGPVQAHDEGKAVELGTPKQRGLLVALLLARGAVVSRDDLVEAVWGDAPPGAAPASLQVYVHGLRKALGESRIERHGDGYRLVVDPGELDLERFEALVARGRAALEHGDATAAAGHLGAALALWNGPALADLAGQPVALQAAELEQARLRALELRHDAELALGHHDAILGEIGRLVAAHPFRERLREQLILALYRAGRQKEALDAYRDARRTLVEELGVEPGPGLRELERAVLRHDASLAAPASPSDVRPRLPVPPTPIVGRRLETAAVEALLQREDVRLVTLTGAGGTGKTRLALAVAEELAAELPGGAVFVGLAQATEPALAVGAIAAALGIHAAATDPTEAVVEALRRRPVLLLLDNLEQLLPDVLFVHDLLSAVPRLHVLATSRAPLRLSGEHEYAVPPLVVPVQGAAFEQVAANDAVRLFAARVQAVDHSFRLNDENVEDVAEICRRVDGLPLALELAAAQARALSPSEITRRLGGALHLLVEGARDLPPRQRTLRATLDWSHELLGEEERTVFARLSVFAGGCSAGAAEAVIGVGDVPARLSALVESSLLRRSAESGGTRFRLLETIRAYALERLRETGEEAGVRDRHAAHFLSLAEATGPQLVTSPSDDLIASLDREHGNLLAALEWAAESGDLATEVRLAVALRPYWSLRGDLGEARRVFEHAISVSAGADPALRAQALVHGAVFAYRAGDSATALAEWEEALVLFRELGDEEEIARCTGELGAAAMAQGDLERAAALWREAAAAFAAQGKHVREASVVCNLASVAAEQGDYVAAVETGQRALALQRELDDREGLAVSVHNLSRWKLALGEREDARVLAAEALEVTVAIGFREVLGYVLGTVGELALSAGEPERGALLLGASEAIFAVTGVARAGEERDGYELALRRLHELLGDERVEQLVAEGAALSQERTLAEARDVLRVPSAG